MKRQIFYILLCFFSLNIYAKDINLTFLNGTWAPENELPTKAQIQLHYEEFYPNDSSFDYIPFNEESSYLGMLKHSGLSYGYLIKSCSVKEKSISCECYEGRFTNSDGIEVAPEKYNVKITIIDDSWIQIEGLENEPLLKESNKLYRVKEGRKEPIYRAIVNDSSIRLRTEPNLQSHTMYILPKNLEVQVVDQSNSFTEIDGEKWCWYKIRSFYFFDGWIYGKYLDINKHPLIEEKCIKIENWGFRKEKLYTYIKDCIFYYYSDFDISIEELQELLQKADCTGDIIKNLNTITKKYEFSHLDIYGAMSSENNGEMFSNIYSSFGRRERNIKATDKKTDKNGVEFKRNKDNSRTIVVKSNKYGCLYGLSIGMKKEAVESIFGTPNLQNKNTITYEAKTFGLYTFEFCFDANNLLVNYSCTYKF